MINKIKLLIAMAIFAFLSSCGGGGDSGGGGTIAGGACSSNSVNSSLFFCQGRTCTKSGNGVICPDGQYCPIPQNLSITVGPICAARSG